MSRRILVIANPAAGFRRADARAEEAVRLLGRLGMSAELHLTAGPGEGERAARDAASSWDLVIAAGGDGTVHDVANGLALTSTPMGVVPLGSMNVLARELGTPLDVAGACAWIARAEPAPVTLGRRDGRWFVLMAGIGYDAFSLEAALARARARPSGNKVRLHDYFLAAALDAQFYRFPRFQIETDAWSGSADFAIVANCARYGGNMRIAARAALEEPVLDLVVFPEGRFMTRVRYFSAILRGRLESVPGVIYRKVSRLAFTAGPEETIPCQLDGEVAAPLPARIESVPGALRLLRTAGR